MIRTAIISDYLGNRVIRVIRGLDHQLGQLSPGHRYKSAGPAERQLRLKKSQVTFGCASRARLRLILFDPSLASRQTD